MRWLSMNVPWFVPGLILTVAVASLAAPALSRRLGASRWVVVSLTLSLGLILSATLTPLADALEGVGSSGRCDTGRVALAPLSSYGRFGDPSLNVLLFLPLGFALALLPR